MLARRVRRLAAAAAAVALWPAVAAAYPGGTPGYQTDAAPYCAACHSSRAESALAGAGERAVKELAANKHIAVIEAGQKGYAELSAEDRATLARHIRAIDEAAAVTLDAPARVAAGDTFEVTVTITGGGGPAAGVMLLDADHRWRARPAPSAGWQVAAPPRITGPDGAVQTEWLERQPDPARRNLAYVNVTGIESDVVSGSWARASVVYTLRAPSRPGALPLAAAYLYGTELATPLGYTTDPVRGKRVRGTSSGASGRVLFTSVRSIEVQ